MARQKIRKAFAWFPCLQSLILGKTFSEVEVFLSSIKMLKSSLLIGMFLQAPDLVLLIVFCHSIK